MAKTCHLVMLPASDCLAQNSRRHFTRFYYNFLVYIRLSLKKFRHPLHKHYCDDEVVCSVKYERISEFSL